MFRYGVPSLSPFDYPPLQVGGLAVSAMPVVEDACPYRVADTVGCGFIFAVFAAPYDAWRGTRQSPRDQIVDGALRMLKTRTPARAGAFALWGLVMSTYDCTFEALRGERDAWNKIAAMGAVRGTLAIRAGPRVAVLRTLEGAALWGMVELFGLAAEGYFRNNVHAHVAERSRGGEGVQVDRFTQRGEEGEQLQPTLTGEWADLTATSEGCCTTPDEVSSTDQQANQQEAPRRLWISGVVLAVTASVAHRYRLPRSTRSTPS